MIQDGLSRQSTRAGTQPFQVIANVIWPKKLYLDVFDKCAFGGSYLSLARTSSFSRVTRRSCPRARRIAVGERADVFDMSESCHVVVGRVADAAGSMPRCTVLAHRA